MKKLILGLIIFVGIFVIPQISFAYEVLYENDFSGNIGGNCIPGWNGVSSTVSASGILKEIKLKTSNIDISPKATSVQVTIHNFNSSTTATSDWGAYPPSTDTYFTLDFSGINQILLTLGDSFFTTVCSNSDYIRLYGGDLASQIVYGDFYNPNDLVLINPLNVGIQDRFINWYINTYVGTSIYPYQKLKVYYGLSSSSFDYVDWKYTGLTNTYFQEVLHIGNLLIPNKNYYARAVLYDGNTTTTLAISDIISFSTISFSFLTQITTSTNPDPLWYISFAPNATSQYDVPEGTLIYGGEATSSLSYGCNSSSTYSLWNMNDWRCIFIKTTDDIKFTIKEETSNMMFKAINVFKQIFPLNIIFQLNDDINQVNATTTDMAITLVGHGSVFPNRTFTILASSTTAWIKDELDFDYKNFISGIMYLFVGGTMLMSSAIIIKNLINPT